MKSLFNLIKSSEILPLPSAARTAPVSIGFNANVVVNNSNAGASLPSGSTAIGPVNLAAANLASNGLVPTGSPCLFFRGDVVRH